MSFWLRVTDAILGVPAAPPPPQAVPFNGDLLDEVCGWVRSGSRVDPETLAAMGAVSEDARKLAKVFMGDGGREALMILAKLTVLRPPVDVTLPADHQPAYAHLRQGQDSIFAAVVHYLDIEQARQRKETHDRYDHSGDNHSGDARFSDDASAFDPAGTIAVR